MSPHVKRVGPVEASTLRSCRRWLSTCRVGQVPQHLTHRISKRVGVVVVRAVLGGSPRRTLVPPIAGHGPSQRAFISGSPQARIEKRTVDRQRATFQREIYARTARHDVPPLGVALDAGQDAEAARCALCYEVEVRDARLS